MPSVSRFGAKRLYRDAGSMASSSVASGLLGAAFWALSARIFPPAELGVMTAVMAVITATGVVVAAGVGDAYTALLPAVGSARVRLYRRGQRMFWIIASIGGVGAAAGTVLLLTEVRGSIGVALLVAFGVLVWSAVNVQSSALVALGRARWLPGANLLTGLVKIGLLPLLAITLRWHAVELAFLIATTGMVVVLGPVIWKVVNSATDLPPATLSEDAALGMFNGFFAQSIASSGLNFGVLTLSPFLVTAFADPEQGALFALVFSIVQTLDVVGMAMALSLVVHASSAPDDAWSMARSVLIKTVLLTVAGALFLIVLAPPALRLLDPAYGALGVTDVVRVLCAVCVVRTVYTVWSALQRSHRNIAAPLRFNVAFAVMLPVLVVTLCRPYGALGGAFALLLAQSALSGAAGIHLLISRRRGGEGVRRVSVSGS
ncbi:O-antigen/teichoic acid export membrane protein [Mycolicibacterium moriokaense]|uniref:O-antigen/teichoic acid export membrane protein n=1 Tax=Mycolicibacterium moriokaense TaxID=39691 RepID=A0A318H9U7_9MYCO|nr:O-antigen/teichoic acid export membrane protein [Mycolicibacterium moriokaense]